MKKLFLFVVLFSWIGFSTSAQIRKDSTKKEEHKESKTKDHKHSKMKMDHKESKMKKEHEKSEMKMGHEMSEMKMDHKMDHNMPHWVFKDGKVMEMKDGKSTVMTTETQVGEVWIRPNGGVVMKNNKVVHLKGNQYLDGKGMIHQMDKKEMKMKEMKMKEMKMDKQRMEPPKIETQ